jgi:hypothetical protein
MTGRSTRFSDLSPLFVRLPAKVSLDQEEAVRREELLDRVEDVVTAADPVQYVIVSIA